jgi:hypothetical protein
VAIPNDLIYGAYNLEMQMGMPNGGVTPATSGTAFGLFFPPVTIFATARHLVDPGFADCRKWAGAKPYEITVRGRHLFTPDGSPSGYFQTIFDTFGLAWPTDNVSDVALIYGFKTKSGYPKIENHAFGAPHIPTPARLAQLTVGAFIGAIGYPQHHDNVDLRPLFRAGHVSSDPRYNHAVARNGSSQQDVGRVIAYDGFSWGGLSGGPVIWHFPEIPLMQPLLVGVNAGHMSAVEDGLRGHAGLSYFYKLDVLAELVNATFALYGWQSPFVGYGISEKVIETRVFGGVASPPTERAVTKSPSP